ncbi:MAG: hypothetical protein AAB019_05315, partial [Planctomycetota bacterium]
QQQLCDLLRQIVKLRLDLLKSGPPNGYVTTDPQWSKILEAEQFYNDGMTFYNAGNYSDAVKQFNQSQKRISQVDKWGPVVNFIVPKEYQFMPNTSTIYVEYYDLHSAVKTKQTKVWINDIDLSGSAIITETGLSLSIPIPSGTANLPDGNYVLKVSVTDSAAYGTYGDVPAGQQTTVKQITFYVDGTPPNLFIDYPTEGITWTDVSQIHFDLSYNDPSPGSSVNNNTLKVLLNEVDVTQVFTSTFTSAAYYPCFDTQEEIDKLIIVYDAFLDGQNELKVSVLDYAGNKKEELRQFFVTLSTISFSTKAPLKIGLEIVSGNNQKGIVGRCAESPLVIRAFNLDNPIKSLNAIPLGFTITQGSGIFIEEKNYSILTNNEGKASLHYHYATFPGVNKVKIGVLNAPETIPVEFSLEGYLPEISLVSIPELKIRARYDSLDDFFRIKVTDPRKNTPLKDIEIKTELFNISDPTRKNEFMVMSPANQTTDEQGEAVFGFSMLDLDGYEQGVWFRFYLPEFIDPISSSPLKVDTQPFQWDFNTYLTIPAQDGGYAQIGVANKTLQNPLRIRLYDFTIDQPIAGTNIIFTSKTIGGKVDGQGSVAKITDVNGYAEVMYTFGPKTEPQLVEVSGKGEKVYFTLGIPTTKFVNELAAGSGLLGFFIDTKYILPWDLSEIDRDPNATPSWDVKYYIEAKMPLFEPAIISGGIDSFGGCRQNINTIDGAIAGVGVDNLQLQRVSGNERYAVYRTVIDNPIVYITGLSYATTPPLLPAGPTYTQASHFGYGQPFAYADEKQNGQSKTPAATIKYEEVEDFSGFHQLKKGQPTLAIPKGEMRKVRVTIFPQELVGQVNFEIKRDPLKPDPPQVITVNPIKPNESPKILTIEGKETGFVVVVPKLPSHVQSTTFEGSLEVEVFDEIKLNIAIYFVHDNSNEPKAYQNKTMMKEADIKDIMEDLNKVWHQYNINFILVDAGTIGISQDLGPEVNIPEVFQPLTGEPKIILDAAGSVETAHVIAFFVWDIMNHEGKSLGGISLGGETQKVVLVSDVLADKPGNTLAHETGHAIGAGSNIDDPDREDELMYESSIGNNPYKISLSAGRDARTGARSLLESQKK